MTEFAEPPEQMQQELDELVRKHLTQIMREYALLVAAGHTIENLVAILVCEDEELSGARVVTLDEARRRGALLAQAMAGGEFVQEAIERVCEEPVVEPWLRLVAVIESGTMGTEIDTSEHLSEGSVGSS